MNQWRGHGGGELQLKLLKEFLLVLVEPSQNTQPQLEVCEAAEGPW